MASGGIRESRRRFSRYRKGAMKLAVVGAGADDRYALSRLGSALAARGHEVEILTASETSAAAGGAEVVAIPIEAGDDDLQPAALMPAISEMGRFLVDRWQRRRPDVVHCFDWTYGMAAQLAAKPTALPTVQSFHGLATDAQAPPSSNRRNLEALLAKNASAVTTACTDDMIDVIRQGCPRPRVSVLPPGVDIDEAAGDGAGAQSDRQRIVCLTADLTSDSGADRVVRALSSLPGVELTLVCAAADRRGLERIRGTAEQCGVTGQIRVVLDASESEVTAQLRDADIAVCPSTYDPYPTFALRAMAAGVAVVATDAGGPRDAVVTDVTGVLVSPGAADVLARALRGLLGQTVLRQGMGLAGRARVRSRYSWERVATDAEVVYEAAMTRSGSSAYPGVTAQSASR